MSFARALKCRQCHREYPLEPLYLCRYCSGDLEVVYDYEALAREISREKIERGPYTVWRYKALLPVEGEPVDLGTVLTPLHRADKLGKALGLEELYIKNDCINPTYSFKDRATAIACTKAREFGFTALACASTGNLACSVAAHAAKAKMEAYVFIPADLEQGKIIGAAIYNPHLIAIQGDFDDISRLCSQIAEKYPWAFVNINLRPYYAEGCKTLAFEIAEQLGWQAPDHVVAPVATGSLAIMCWKALRELALLKLIPEANTRLHITQPRGCSPVVTAFEAERNHVQPVQPRTIAKSLAVGTPFYGNYALQVTRETGGGAAAATDDEIVEGIKLLAEREGIFTEAAGGVVIAGLRHLVDSGRIKPGERTVALITGAGYRTLEAVEGRIASAIVIEPNLASFQRALEEKGFYAAIKR